MKKFLSLVIILFTFSIFTSCSKKITIIPSPPAEGVAEDVTEHGKEPEEIKEEIITKEDNTIIPTDNIIDETKETSNEVKKDPIYYTGFGLLHEIASPYDSPYIIVDEAEFFRDAEAKEEALKDGLIVSAYYIRNNYDILTEYPISENCTYYLSSWMIQDYLGKEVPIGLSSDSYEVSFEEFNQIVQLEDFTFKTWFECEDGYVVKLYHQYTP